MKVINLQISCKKHKNFKDKKKKLFRKLGLMALLSKIKIGK
jgi:hypothetical protein